MRRFSMVSALLLGAAVPAVAQTAAEQVQAGIAARDSLDADGALQHFRAAVAADSTSYEANWRLALAFIDVGKETPDNVKSPARDSLYALAETYARRAVRLNPNDAEGHFVLADAIGRASLTKSKKERVERAAEIRNEALAAIRLDPRHDGAYPSRHFWRFRLRRQRASPDIAAAPFRGNPFRHGERARGQAGDRSA